ncbi:MAG: rod shape-determining protein MreD [Spirochaetaceae bacterium]|nr:rod shape-determining protein MreD [Spirochaetaceae bacterium]
MGDLRVILATTVLAVGASLLSSTLLSWVTVAGVKPDLALVIVALMAMRRGSMPGQIAGFASGLLADTISVAPLGLTAMTRTVVGYVIGRMEGLISVDWLLLPAAVAIAATVLKALSLAAVGLAVPWISSRYGLGPSAFLTGFLIEAGLNAVAAPAMYVLLSLLPGMRDRASNQVQRVRLRR